ncbi:isochorismatase family cysteine hydrolase [Candidatus Bipolaricaulota bacterium]
MKYKRFVAMLLGTLLLSSSAAIASQACATALLIVDVQMNLLAMGGSRLQTIYNQPILESVEAIVASARVSGLPIIYSKYVTGPLVASPDLVRFPESIAPRDVDHVVVRSGVDPLDPTLVELLEQESISQLIVCGLYSTCCVDNAICAADELGYEIVVIVEGHGDYETNLVDARARQAVWKTMSNVVVEKFDDLDLSAFCGS